MEGDTTNSGNPDSRKKRDQAAPTATNNILSPGGAGPLAFLNQAISAVPAVKYALAVGGIVAVIAIIFSFGIDARVAVIGAVIMFIFMTMMIVFARLSVLAEPYFALPSLVFTWFTLLLFMGVAASLFTSVFFSQPLDLHTWLAPEQKSQSSGVALDASNNAVASEIAFRVSQVDQIIQRALKNGQVLHDDMRKGPVNGEKIRDFSDQIGMVHSVFKICGIFGLPSLPDATVWFGYSGFGERHLPDGRSYKFENTRNFSIIELFQSASKGIDKNQMDHVNTNVATLKDTLDQAPEEIAKEITKAQLHVQPSVVGYQTEVDSYLKWIRILNNEWKALKSSLSIT